MITGVLVAVASIVGVIGLVFTGAVFTTTKVGKKPKNNKHSYYPHYIGYVRMY